MHNYIYVCTVRHSFCQAKINFLELDLNMVWKSTYLKNLTT